MSYFVVFHVYTHTIIIIVSYIIARQNKTDVTVALSQSVKSLNPSRLSILMPVNYRLYQSVALRRAWTREEVS